MVRQRCNKLLKGLIRKPPDYRYRLLCRRIRRVRRASAYPADLLYRKHLPETEDIFICTSAVSQEGWHPHIIIGPDQEIQNGFPCDDADQNAGIIHDRHKVLGGRAVE